MTFPRARRALEKERARLLALPSKEIPKIEGDEGDEASAFSERRLGEILGARESAAIHAIDAALARMTEGTYGECQSCEEPIGAKRLELCPTAELCVRCQEEKERRNHDAE